MSRALYGAALSAGDIAITTGCNQAFFVAAVAAAPAGDVGAPAEPLVLQP